MQPNGWFLLDKCGKENFNIKEMKEEKRGYF